MDKGVIYARFSSQSQNEQSIEAQVRICKEFAENKDIQIVNVYSDKARTGTNDARLAFQRMISDAKSGALVYGYKIETEPIAGKSNKVIKRVVINEDEAKIIKFIFEQYDKGFSKLEIAKMLNEQGERYKGKPFKGRTFDKWMLNEKYTGEFTFGGRRCDNMYPAIVDKDLFERVRKRLTANKYTAGGQATAKEPYLLTGKLYCGHCGTEMVSGGGTSETGVQHHYYVCKKKRSGKCDKRSENKDNLELYVTNCVRDFLSDKKNAETAVDDVLAYCQIVVACFSYSICLFGLKYIF